MKSSRFFKFNLKMLQSIVVVLFALQSTANSSLQSRFVSPRRNVAQTSSQDSNPLSFLNMLDYVKPFFEPGGLANPNPPASIAQQFVQYEAPPLQPNLAIDSGGAQYAYYAQPSPVVDDRKLNLSGLFDGDYLKNIFQSPFLSSIVVAPPADYRLTNSVVASGVPGSLPPPPSFSAAPFPGPNPSFPPPRKERIWHTSRQPVQFQQAAYWSEAQDAIPLVQEHQEFAAVYRDAPVAGALMPQQSQQGSPWRISPVGAQFQSNSVKQGRVPRQPQQYSEYSAPPLPTTSSVNLDRVFSQVNDFFKQFAGTITVTSTNGNEYPNSRQSSVSDSFGGDYRREQKPPQVTFNSEQFAGTMADALSGSNANGSPPLTFAADPNANGPLSDDTTQSNTGNTTVLSIDLNQQIRDFATKGKFVAELLQEPGGLQELINLLNDPVAREDLFPPISTATTPIQAQQGGSAEASRIHQQRNYNNNNNNNNDNRNSQGSNSFVQQIRPQAINVWPAQAQQQNDNWQWQAQPQQS